MITKAAITKYVALFCGQLPDIAVAALRTLFRLGSDLASVVEDALLHHGGGAGLELQGQDREDAAPS